MRCLVLMVMLVEAHGYVQGHARGQELPRAKGAYVVRRALGAKLAHQAAAADPKYVYAISNSVIARHDRESGEEIARSTGEAQHLNSGVFWKGKLYCAHSNYPRKPHESSIRVLDPATMKLDVWHTFADPPGSLTWALPRGEHWWCLFAHYGKDNAKTVLARYEKGWRESGRWMFPKNLIADWGSYSLSGGVWLGDDLLATGHDKKVIYRLRVPEKGKLIELIEVVPAPFPGQGLAVDTLTGQLVGIDRARRQVLFAGYKEN